MAGVRYTPLEMLARLVAFDTESAKSNLPLIDFVEDYLKGWDVPHIRVPNAAGDKAAIYATLGPADRGGVVLSGSLDDGSRGLAAIHDARGTTMVVTPSRHRTSGMPETAITYDGPIHILLSYDEETTCLGVMDTIARFGLDLPPPRAVIVGEPTRLEVVDAHKSIATFFTTVHGHEAHSSKPALGANAVMAAAELVCELTRIADAMIARGDPSGRFAPPYTTVHVGPINGGTARNILPKSCVFHWEFRGLPDLDPDEIPNRLQRFADEVALPRLNRHGPFGRIETELEVFVPGLAPAPGSEAEQLALRLAGRNATATVPFATEAGRFQGAGIATIVCGPGSIDQAHQPDEYITLEDLAAGEAFIRRLAEHCTRG